MFIGHFSEQPWQKEDWPAAWGSGVMEVSNSEYDPFRAANLYNRYMDEKVYAEEMGFDGIMVNEHHSAPFCMNSVANVTASILARITTRAKIVILGNVLPIHEDPLWLAEALAMIDVISRGRLIPGVVRGGGSESLTHNAPPHFNRERFEEAIREYEEAIRLRPEQATAHYNLAVTLERAGQKERARQEYENYLQLSPDATDAAEVRDHLKKLASSAH